MTLEALAEQRLSQEEADLELALNFIFHSSTYLRYENSIHVSGPHGEAHRAIKVEKNINGGDGFTVRIFNMQDYEIASQMSPKQMKVVSVSSDKIILTGFGEDFLGNPFSCYGLTVVHNSGEIEKIIFHLFYRKIDIEFLPI